MELQHAPKVVTVANLVKLVRRIHPLRIDCYPYMISRIYNVFSPHIWRMQMNYQNKHLVGAMIVAGWDSVEGGQVYGCPIGGTIIREKWTTDGSGSTFIWGYLDAEYKDGMTREEAENLVQAALALAMARDASSGGVIRIVTIDKDGARRRMVTPDEHMQMWDDIPEQPIGIHV